MSLSSWFGTFWHSQQPGSPSTPPTIPPLSSLGHFACLPPEIILAIVDRLPVLTQCLFALTCRAFYAAYWPGSWVEDWTFKESRPWVDFLLLLERDMPGFYFCYARRVLLPCVSRPSLFGIWRPREHDSAFSVYGSFREGRFNYAYTTAKPDR